jgi:hypothetical protein
MVVFKTSFMLLSFLWLLPVFPSGFSHPLKFEVAGISTLPYNFTLAAYNVTLPNYGQNGAPLVLGQNGTYPRFVVVFDAVSD